MIENISPGATLTALRDDPDAQLVDVRTDVEWSFVGVPDIDALGKQVHLLSWQNFPTMQANPHFAADLRAMGLGPHQKLYFLCRSGVRSQAAAQAARQDGFASVHNVADGFEGPLDGEGHRGRRAGWKAAGCPWRQG